MKKSNLRIKFDGPELRAHEMDVALLGPSLFSFGELCREANKIINGEDTKIKVLIKADIAANCVTVELAVILSYWEQLKAFVGSQGAKDVREVLEWVGVVGGAIGVVGAAGWTLIKFLRWKGDAKETKIEVLRESGGSLVSVTIEGDNNTVVIPETVYKLAQSAKVVEALKGTVAPVSSANGIEDATFVHGTSAVKIDLSAAREIKRATPIGVDIEPQIFTAHIVIYSPVLDPLSKKWKFKFNNRVESIDISETAIAAEAFERGRITIGDTYKVRMEMTERRTPTGGFASDYKVKEVLSFTPGTRAEQTLMKYPETPPETESAPKDA